MDALAAALSRINKVTLGQFPTPLHPLERLGEALGHRDIFIKREDLAGIGFGGNKVRSLEFILGQAVHGDYDTIVVYGPLQSNVCTLTACACAKLGLKCVCIHNAERPEIFEGNLLLNRLVDVESIFLGKITPAARNQYALEYAEKLKNAGRKPYVVLNGATSGEGALGYIAGCLELWNQVKTQQLPIKTIFAPGGNSGVASGLIYGNYLLGMPFEVVIISVEDDVQTLTDHIKTTIAAAEKILGLPFKATIEDICTISDAYLGEGWGANTVESERFVHRMPQMEGIFVENVYTSKVLVGLEDFIIKGRVKGGVCYLHTGGLGALFSQY